MTHVSLFSGIGSKQYKVNANKKTKTIIVIENVMKILHLTLKREWFYRHLEDKPEDYREITPYWVMRLLQWFDGTGISTLDAEKIANQLKSGEILLGGFLGVVVRPFDMAQARNGYAANAPTWLKKFKTTAVGIGNPAWGAPSHSVFIIELGEVIETKNINRRIR